MRKTYQMAKAAEALMVDPTGRHWGYDLAKRSGLRSGVLYPILHRFLEAGLLADGWEKLEDTNGKRPPRRYYTVTGAGRVELAEMLRELAAEGRYGVLAPRMA